MYKHKIQKVLENKPPPLLSPIFQLPNSPSPETNTTISCLNILPEIY